MSTPLENNTEGLNAILQQAYNLPDANSGGESRCTPQLFGAVGDGVTDDSAALNSWFSHLADNDVFGYIPNGTYLVKSGVGYAPDSPSGKRISFVGESADRTIIKAGFTSGTVLDFWNCYIGEIGNLTIDNNENTPNESGVTGFRMVDMQYAENVFSYIHDINIVNVGRRAGLIHHSAGAGSTAIKYVNMERVNVVGFTSDRTLWGQKTADGKENVQPVGIIAADVSHFHFINCTARNVKSYPLEFKNLTEYCSNENCVIENCGQGIYLGQQWIEAGGDPDTIGHRYYKAIGNVIKDVPVGVMASNLAHCTFDNNTIYAYNDESGSVAGFLFNAPCEYVTGTGNSYYGDRYAVQFRKGAAVNGTCNDNVIETAIYKTAFTTPYSFTQQDVPAYSYRCTVIATNYQQTAKTTFVDENNNSYIPLINVMTER